ncbi:NAD-glutamate dehydrogenase [Marmoricola endophyticus]|uniref:NAD-glutamate dehydrogenase n=1 Tax=Marmoricola endophyticus TaxID=2040280 RepID=A0A917BS50_9ACTN|nr:NAD-glutamate dehydrogenase [Marmoricola endophyticus]GGF56708.1 NAD-glutamate dehydrogenase [Marmoricola endophyticus]
MATRLSTESTPSPDPSDEQRTVVPPVVEELIEGARRLPPVPGVDLESLIRVYYRDLDADDVEGRASRELGASVLHHLSLAQRRPSGTALVDVSTPTTERDGWSLQGRTAVEVVTDDMPFLVDSVQMALEAAGHEVRLLVHPQYVVRRDTDGSIVEVRGQEASVAASDTGHESWMHIEIESVDAAEEQAVAAAVTAALDDVRRVVEDWPRMRRRAEAVSASLHEDATLRESWESQQAGSFLHWLADDHFTFLGYQEYDVVPGDGGSPVLRAVPGTGSGLLRSDRTLEDEAELAGDLAASASGAGSTVRLLHISKAAERSTVHRLSHMDQVTQRLVDSSGQLVGERRFLGLFSSAAYTESVTRVPVLRERARRVLELAGLEQMSHDGKAVMDVLEGYPRDELFQTSPEQLVPIAKAVSRFRTRRELRVFLRRDDYGRFVSCVVYLPRDRYNTPVRDRFTRILTERTGAASIEFTARVSDALAARLHLVARPAEGEQLLDVDTVELEAELSAAARSWDDDLVEASSAAGVTEHAGVPARTLREKLGGVPEAYKEDYEPHDGMRDLARLASMGPDEVEVSLAREQDGDARLKMFRTGDPVSLSTVLPVLTAMGVDVVDERPYLFHGLGTVPSHLYDFGLHRSEGWPAERVAAFEEAVLAVWDGRAESDGFNALVLAAGLSWRQVSVLRAYARYQRQGGSSYSSEYVEETLAGNVSLAADLVALFEARFDPDRGEPDAPERVAACEEIEERIAAGLDEVAALDQDKILRSMLGLVRATLRTNYFQGTLVDGERVDHDYLSFKLDPREVPDLPAPRPRFEIWVYSPRVEGVHLRFGRVARGGLRWSDRRDDFRTEVLGLVKAQMVKNTVIVPVGAKGGFVGKRLPDPSDREAWQAEGVACYTTFISGLLDLTDNLVDGPEGARRVVAPPQRVVRHDPDDTYLVVAADKGTATFSDIANGVAADYGFWLGDAFASGGSVGYDHKAMGITAKGAWVSVQRHFRERGIDCQTQDFTAVGIGDMSGDVFGNGMLESEHTRLVAAFDHRDIFLDPDPDPAASYAERQRMFALPRSSWQDYDTAAISEGGGVYSRRAKSVPISAQVREALGLQDGVTSLSPPELVRAILLAPVDLLWNGGIGTYVKASSETNADAGDKANDLVRVDGKELRCALVGEGGNLGLTQRGRIEYAVRGRAGEGGRINTDFIDNSAGVDTSDHEVNIKVLLDSAVAAGELDAEARHTLLASMTDEVAALVLADNDEQNLALANSASRAFSLLHVHEEMMRWLERSGRLDRELEGLPSRREVAARIEQGGGMTVPELSVLLAYAKIVLSDELLETDIAEDPFLRGELFSYFPAPLRQEYRQAMQDHPLRAQIVVTQIVNRLINEAGITYLHRLGEETGASVAELARANFVAREVLGTEALLEEIHAQDFLVDAAVQTRMRVEVRTLVERVSRWLVDNFRAPLDSEAIVEHFGVIGQQVIADLPSLMSGRELAAFEERREEYVAQGASEHLAAKVAALPPAYMVVGVVETARREQLDAAEVARVHFALGERLGLPTLVQRILALPRSDRWESLARAALRDDLHGVHAELTAEVLARTSGDESAAARVDDWESIDHARVSAAADTLGEICSEESSDLARLSVGLRVVRSLVG